MEKWGSPEQGAPRSEQVPTVLSAAPAGDVPCLPLPPCYPQLPAPGLTRGVIFPPFLPKFVHAQGSREPARTSLEPGLFWLSIAC